MKTHRLIQARNKPIHRGDQKTPNHGNPDPNHFDSHSKIDLPVTNPDFGGNQNEGRKYQFDHPSRGLRICDGF
jgi:hypothetical protein